MDIDWMVIISQVLQAVLVMVIPPLVVMLVKWLSAKIELLKAQVLEFSPDLVFILDEVARIAVAAAEQSKLAGLIEDKKSYAYDIIEKWLAAKNLVIDIDLIEAAIERQVLEQFPQPVPPANIVDPGY